MSRHGAYAHDSVVRIHDCPEQSRPGASTFATRFVHREVLQASAFVRRALVKDKLKAQV